jgi:outer membrane receptor protein involved in Fe transport
VTYVNNMVDNLTVSLSVFNLTDEDPPQVANDLNYDPYNHSPFGRMVKLGVTYNLGQN